MEAARSHLFFFDYVKDPDSKKKDKSRFFEYPESNILDKSDLFHLHN